MSKQIEVVALEAGHDGRVYRPAGTRWYVPEEAFDKDGKHVAGSTWFVPVEKAPEPTAKKKNATPPGAGPKPGSALAASED